MSEIKKRTKSKSALGNIAENVTKVDKKFTQNDGEQKAGDKQSQNRHIPLRVFSRIVVITSLLIVVYFTSKDDKFKTLAKQSEVLSGKGQTVDCSADFIKELTRYEDCVPRDCGRYITDKVISNQEADELLKIAKKGLKLGGSSGGASILDLHSGALSMGEHFINIYKKEGAESLFTEKDFKTYQIIKNKIKFAICHHFDVEPNKIYLTHPTFFSEITAKKAVTLHDEYWHPHVDKETYKSFHFTSLLYLSDYNIDFEGGRFVFIDEKQNRTVEPKKGRVSMFTSGAENTHYVEKVTNGVRHAMTISFTCDKQYSIEDPSLEKYTH